MRHLIELLDGAVERSYADVGLNYRPRYTPIMRALIDKGAATVSEIADTAAISQPAVTQTIGRMVDAGIVSIETGTRDGRQRIVRLTPAGQGLVPELALCWNATAVAAQSLDRDLEQSLGAVLDAAIAALEQRSYDDRIKEARTELARGQ